MLDAAAYTVLWQIADSIGVRPEWLLPVLGIESGLDPSVPNLQGYPYYGLNQISGTYLQQHGITPADYLTWPASEQLSRVVLPYLASQVATYGPLQSGARLYLANFYPAALSSATTLASNIVCKPARACRPKGETDPYCANQGLDADHSGCITVGDLAHKVSQSASAAYVKAAIARAYTLRPWETQSDPALGYDFGPKPAPIAAPATRASIGEALVIASAAVAIVVNAPRVWRALTG